jgi:N utilization substance protein B
MQYISAENTSFSEFCNASNLSLASRRGLILHILYSIDMHDYDVPAREIIFFYNVDYGIIIEQNDEIFHTIEQITLHKEILDAEISPYFKNWHFNRISIITKLILRYAVWELKERKSDSTLVINEAVELAKGYSEKDSFRFVNAVLDAWSKNLLATKKE